MDNYNEFILGPKAIEYIQMGLAAGLTLSKHTLERIKLDNGVVMTALPKNTNLEFLDRFEYGGILPKTPESEWHRVTAGIEEQAINNIKYYLQSRKKRLCIFEDIISIPTDPFVKDNMSRISTFQNEVYIVLSGKKSNSEIQQALREAEMTPYPPLIGIMTSLPQDISAFPISQEITDDLLIVLAQRTEKIVIGAWDWEGYLIWHKEKSSTTS
jgi:hypothetical protein